MDKLKLNVVGALSLLAGSIIIRIGWEIGGWLVRKF